MDSVDKSVYPRITKSYARSLIKKEQIVIDHEMSVVICIVKLVNNHRLITDAIVANSSLFDPDKGTQIAREKMIERIMELEMYQMRTHLHEQRLKEVNRVD